MYFMILFSVSKIQDQISTNGGHLINKTIIKFVLNTAAFTGMSLVTSVDSKT